MGEKQSSALALWAYAKHLLRGARAHTHMDVPTSLCVLSRFPKIYIRPLSGLLSVRGFLRILRSISQIASEHPQVHIQIVPVSPCTPSWGDKQSSKRGSKGTHLFSPIDLFLTRFTRADCHFFPPSSVLPLFSLLSLSPRARFPNFNIIDLLQPGACLHRCVSSVHKRKSYQERTVYPWSHLLFWRVFFFNFFSQMEERSTPRTHVRARRWCVFWHSSHQCPRRPRRLFDRF